MLILYSTPGCHLCDDAEALLQDLRQADVCQASVYPANRSATLEWRVVDIANDDALFERYGWLIPVLQQLDGTELRWPFDAHQLMTFLALEH